jgi:drug/metabolite transporter (DMT)-like permease
MSDQKVTAGAAPAAHARSGLDAATLVAFLAASFIAGANAVAVRVGLTELAPFWGAAVRFLIAAAILVLLALAMRRSFPAGRALVGAMIYGLLTFGLSYMFLYWALQEATAGTVMVAFAITPLLTLLLAVAQRVERFRVRALIGALVAAAGIAIVFADKMGAVSPLTLAAILAAAVVAAEAPVVVKIFPKVDPAVENGIGMAVGGALLLLASMLAGEPWKLPSEPMVQLSLAYLILFGSVGLFLLFLFVLARWTASASAYVLLLAPLAAVGLDLLVLGEAPSLSLILGGALAIAGVYVGVARPREQQAPVQAGKTPASSTQ